MSEKHFKVKTETVICTEIEPSKHWKDFGIHEVHPRSGVLGWLGRKLGIYKLGWKDILVVKMKPLTAEEINKMITDDSYLDEFKS